MTYHKAKLIEAGVGFQWPRVFFGALASVWGLAMNPGSTAKRLQNAPQAHKEHKENEWSDPVAAGAANRSTGKISDAV